MVSSAPPAVRSVSDRERGPAGLLAVALWGQLLGSWILDDFSPAAITLATVRVGVHVIRETIQRGSLAGIASVDALGGVLCGVVMLNMVLGVEAIWRRTGRTLILRGRAFWWWTVVQGSAGTGILVWISISLSMSFGGAISLQEIRVIGLAFAEVLIASYVLRHVSFSAPSREKPEA